MSKPIPQVSIGMPVYNGEKFIREALDSLLAQTFTDFELIISDNASTDGTEAICREYAARDPRIRYVRQSENRGAAANFRFVLDEAVGEYFMWAAADDIWGKGFIEKCTNLLDRNPQTGMAMTGYVARSYLARTLNLKFKNNPLSCIEIQNKKERLLEYSKMPFSSHKDNLVYALWRRRVISKVTAELSRINLANFIGGAANEYALWFHKGAYLPEVMFYKRYRFTPPGHWLGPTIGYISIAYRILTRRPFKLPWKRDISGVAKFMRDLNAVLDLMDTSEEFKKEITRCYEKNLRLA